MLLLHTQIIQPDKKGSILACTLLSTAHAEEIQKEIICLNEAGDWTSCRSLIAEIYTPLTEAEQQLDAYLSAPANQYVLVGDQEDVVDVMYNKLEEMNEFRNVYSCRSDFDMHFSVGDDLRRQLYFENEYFQPELAWLLIDAYRAAGML